MASSLQEEEEEVQVVMGMERRDEQLLPVLLRHCWDMKRQETRLRRVTLLLLLGCASLYVFTFCMDLRRRQRSPQAAGLGDSGEQSAPHVSPERSALPHSVHNIQLTSKPEAKDGAEWQLMMWQKPGASGFSHDEDKGAIVVPATGVYFLYVTFQLICHDGDKDPDFRKLDVEVVSWSDGYGDPDSDHTTLMRATDGVTCSPLAFRSVFVGQRVELSEGDHVSVRISDGYDLISTSKFGAHFLGP